MSDLLWLLWIVFVVFIGLVLLVNIFFRVVVPTNEVHIVQSKKATTIYGKWHEKSVYFRRPAWFPVLGIQRIVFPTTVFDITLDEYQAYDIWRVPFSVDIKAFFRVSDASLAAERIDNMQELIEQLEYVVQWAVRAILASVDIEEILWWRSEFGQRFTDEVREQLKRDRGIEVVKNIEFMDINDADWSNVVTDIQKKKESQIAKDSRVAIAENEKIAKMAEIDAAKLTEEKEQEKQKFVGIKTVESQKEVELARQLQLQEVQEAAKITKEREMSVLEVQEVQQAAINKQKEVIKAQETAEIQVIQADADKETQARDAEAELITKQREADAIKAIWEAEADKILQIARADAEKIQTQWEAQAIATEKQEVALVAGKIKFMEELKNNTHYTQYLATIENIKAQEMVWVEQAKALQKANIKYVWTDGWKGITWLSDLLTPSWLGTFGAGLDAFSEMMDGKTVVDVMKSIVTKNILTEENKEQIQTMLFQSPQNDGTIAA